MKFFLDFDYVVFDTGRFNFNRVKIFEDHGIKREIFLRYFEEFKRRRKNREPVTYSQRKHIESLEKTLVNFDFEKPKKVLAEFMENLEEYVFEEFYDFAKAVGKKNLYLVSYGDFEFQSEKIKNSGVEEYFNEVIVTNGLKSMALLDKFRNNKNILTDGKVYFVDDHVAHLKDVKEKIPQVKTLLMYSEKGEHGDERENEFCDGVVRSFGGIKELLKLNNQNQITNE